MAGRDSILRKFRRQPAGVNVNISTILCIGQPFKTLLSKAKGIYGTLTLSIESLTQVQSLVIA